MRRPRLINRRLASRRTIKLQQLKKVLVEMIRLLKRKRQLRLRFAPK